MLAFGTGRKKITYKQSPQIFISYSRKDISLADEIISELKNLEYKIWIDTQDILPTSEWWHVILDAINNSAVFLIIVSENSMDSEVCKSEFEYAYSHDKKIVPLLLESIDPKRLPASLQKLNWVKWKYIESFKTNINELIFAVNIDLGWHTLRTTLMSQAEMWKKNNQTKDMLLQGNMLLNAEKWLDDSYKDKGKLITPDLRRFILKSRKVVANKNLFPVLNGIILLIFLIHASKIAGAPLETRASPLGLTSLELGGDKNIVNDILMAWSTFDSDYSIAKSNIFIDFGVIYLYLSTFLYGLRYFITYFHRISKTVSRTGIIFFFLLIVVGTSDLIENILMLRILQGSFYDLSWLLEITSIVKFILMCFVLLYFVFCILYTVILRKRLESIELKRK